MVKKILTIFGTRPEAIKMAPLIIKLKKDFNTKICLTAQHREMLDQVINLFEIEPDYDLDVMKHNQNLFGLTTELLNNLQEILEIEKPDLVLVHGDTTTTLSAAMGAFYLKIPIGHIEAGLRTYNHYSPFPEELNRQLTSKLANLHFAPTETARQNLLKENIPSKNIFVTGNTIIDALFSVIEKSKKEKYPSDLVKTMPFLSHSEVDKPKIVLVTGHRRENFGTGFEQICLALKSIAQEHANIKIIYPVHLNPNVIEPVQNLLGNIENIHLIKPMEYLHFIKLMNDSYIVLTDSGGLQEEAPSIGKPVLVMRDTTERPEAVEAGTVKIVGTSTENIISTTNDLLKNNSLYSEMSRSHNPYGDGKACMRISKILQEDKHWMSQ